MNTQNSLLKTLLVGSDKDYLIENLSVLLASGTSVMVSLDLIQSDIRSSAMKSIVSEIRESVASGVPVWKSFEKTGIYADHVISLMRIGEDSGTLPENLAVIATQTQKERELQEKITSAMIYPLFLLVVSLVITVSMSWFVLPHLAVVFSQLRIQLPIITQIFISIGLFLGAYGFVVIPLFSVITLLTLYFMFIFPKTRHIGQNLLFHIPPIRQLLIETEMARLGFLLGNLLNAGLPIVDSLDSLSHNTSLTMFQALYRHLKESIETGNSFQKSLADYPKLRMLMPHGFEQMLVSSEQSGSLPETLLKMGTIYENRTDTTTKNLTVLLEPILLIIVWLGVIFIALAIILPLYSLIGGLNN